MIDLYNLSRKLEDLNKNVKKKLGSLSYRYRKAEGLTRKNKPKKRDQGAGLSSKTYNYLYDLEDNVDEKYPEFADKIGDLLEYDLLLEKNKPKRGRKKMAVGSGLFQDRMSKNYKILKSQYPNEPHRSLFAEASKLTSEQLK